VQSMGEEAAHQVMQYGDCSDKIASIEKQLS
jgi:hypothetical protein